MLGSGCRRSASVVQVPTVIPLRFRPEFCAFFAQQFESEWRNWYGPGGQGNAREDVEAFANPEGNLPVGVIDRKSVV